jgi:hypothetical protein
MSQPDGASMEVNEGSIRYLGIHFLDKIEIAKRKCRENEKELNEEAFGPGGTNSPNQLLELLQIGSWMKSPQHPTGDLEITEANGD